MKSDPVIDDYIAALPEEHAKVLRRLRQLIHTLVPEAEEYISYGMPAVKYRGPLVAFAAAKQHYALYPMNGTLVITMQKELAGYSTSKGTIRFSYDESLPVELIKKIVLYRMQENIKKT